MTGKRRELEGVGRVNLEWSKVALKGLSDGDTQNIIGSLNRASAKFMTYTPDTDPQDLE